VKIIRNITDLHLFLEEYKRFFPLKIIGFVPTMGALHAGHMSLIKQAKNQCNLVICSIFVNPTQFNDKSDLEKYPRTEVADIELLKSNQCDVVFIPSKEDIYPNKKIKYLIDLNGLDTVLEGKYRDNHFVGVCMVVERLFKLVMPNKAFFGIKDFQQVAIIKHMVNEKNIDINIVACPIIREESGLAMSSRNMLLLKQDKKEAVIISQALFKGLEAYKNGFQLTEVLKVMLKILNESSLQLEYLEIVNNDTLQNVTEINDNSSVCIAAYCGKVRLIDNCQFS